MRSNYLVVSVKEVVNYLQNRSGIDFTKDHELGAAVLFARFHEKETGEKHNIALRLRTAIPNNEHWTENFWDHVEENHDIDFYLVPKSTDLTSKSKLKVPAFQLKRFHLSESETGKKLHSYLMNDIPKKYPGNSDGVLGLIFKGRGNISKEDFEKINDSLNLLSEYPFGRIFFVTGEDGVKITFGELFPKFGHKTYSVSDWMK